MILCQPIDEAVLDQNAPRSFRPLVLGLLFSRLSSVAFEVASFTGVI